MFRQLGIYAPSGQHYKPGGRREADVLPRGRARADARGGHHRSRIAVVVHRRRRPRTAPTRADDPVLHLLLDVRLSSGSGIWSGRRATAARAAFCSAGPPGRTTLNGEGLQHEDGHSHVLFSVVPNCRAYDPTYAYEVATIIQDGLRAMLADQEDVFYYLTLLNENYTHPAMPEGPDGSCAACTSSARRLRGAGPGAAGATARLGLDPARGARGGRPAGGGLRRARGRLERDLVHRAPARRNRGRALEPAAPARRAAHHATSTELPVRAARPGHRLDRLHPHRSPTRSAVGAGGPTTCSAPTASAAAITARPLRRFFEVDRHHVALAALAALADAEVPQRAGPGGDHQRYEIDADAPIPTTRMSATCRLH